MKVNENSAAVTEELMRHSDGYGHVDGSTAAHVGPHGEVVFEDLWDGQGIIKRLSPNEVAAIVSIIELYASPEPRLFLNKLLEERGVSLRFSSKAPGV